MVRLQSYARFSVIATLAVIYHAFSSRGQFYPAMVYLSTSKIILNMGLVFTYLLWQLAKKIILSSLREAEVEQIKEKLWREARGLLFAVTFFMYDFPVTFLAMVTVLFLIKALHWLAQKRAEHMESVPSVPKLPHIRIMSFLGFLLLVDCSFMYSLVKYWIENKHASLSLFFTFQYMLMATTTVATIVKYALYVSDMHMEEQWEKKAVYTFYLELIRDLLHFTTYMCFFIVVYVNYGVPPHMVPEPYETITKFIIRVDEYIRYRTIASNMNNYLPDVTLEELNTSDATCIICREEMIAAKKLNCGHLFHLHCLRSWLERQSTCPTCKFPVVPPENGTSTSGSIADVHQQGSSTEGASSQATAGGRVGNDNDNLSQHQSRLQAAAAAAAIYKKSFVYPSPNSVVWAPGFSFVPQTSAHPSHMNDGGGGAVNGAVPQHYPNMIFAPIPQSAESADFQHDLQIKLIEDQIEFLRDRLRLMRASKNEETMPRVNR